MEPHEAFLKAYRAFVAVLIGAAVVCFMVPLMGWVCGAVIMLFVGVLKLVEIAILIGIGLFLLLRRLLRGRPRP